MDEWRRLYEAIDNIKQELRKEYEPFFSQLLKIISRVINYISIKLF